jgi:hypothetical protein
MHSDHEPNLEAEEIDEARELSDDELDDVAGGSGFRIGKELGD